MNDYHPIVILFWLLACFPIGVAIGLVGYFCVGLITAFLNGCINKSRRR